MAHRSVTPCMGVWIETFDLMMQGYKLLVTPCMGVWIETNETSRQNQEASVTPCMGVWIETTSEALVCLGLERHTLYGCVD